MNKKTITKVLFLLLSMVGTYLACGCTENLAADQPKDTTADSIETILKRLNCRAAEIESYQCHIEYLFSQPLFESETLRKGLLYYQRSNGKSTLRINLRTLKQDDEKEHRCIEHYIFDGVWLTHIDHQIRTVKRRQLAEPNEPVDAFDLARENFPLIGFTEAEDLKKDFDIELVEQKIEQSLPVIPAEAGIHDFIQLHLRVKPDSAYKDDFVSIDFCIDRKLYLPVKIVAVSTEEDIYEIKLLDVGVNKEIDKEVFEIKIPEGFDIEEVLLEKKDK